MNEELNFLIVEDNEEIREIISIELEGQWPMAEVYTAESGNKAIEIVKSPKSINFIICDLNMNEGSGIDFYNFLESFEIDLPFLFVTGDHIDHHKPLQSLKSNYQNISFLRKPFEGAELIHNIAEMLSLTIDKEKNSFKKISLERLKMVRNYHLNLYIKKNEESYIKITKTEDGHVDEFGEKYGAKGIREFYTPTSEYIKFIEYLDNNLKKLLKNGAINIAKKIELQLDSIKHIHESLIGLGFKTSAMELAKENIQICLKIIRGDKNLAEILSKTIFKDQYKYSLSLLNSYISIAIAGQTTWATKQALEKLALAGILQDISLESHLVKYNDLQTDDFQNLTEKEKQLILHHPDKSIDLISGIDFSNDLKNLILHHHERPNGAGFPFKRNDRTFSPLMCIHILANEFSYVLMKTPLTQKDLLDALKWMDVNCTSGNFRKGLESFKIAFKAGLSKK